MKLAAISLVLILVCCSARAATHTAATAAFSDVQTAYNACSSGDTLAIPAGNAIWNQTLNVTTPLAEITGAGKDSTIISNTSSGTFFAIAPSADVGIRLTAIRMVQPNNYTVQPYGVTVKGQVHGFRIDRCAFCYGKTIIAINSSRGSGPAYGVIDHNYFTNCSREVYVADMETADGANRDGFTAWGRFNSSPSTYVGTTNCVCIETNYFFYDNALPGDNDEPLYNERGAVVILRYNFYQDNYSGSWVGVDMHGAYGGTSGEAAGIVDDMYNNTWVIASTYRMTHQRGGMWFLHDNHATISAGGAAHIYDIGSSEDVTDNSTALPLGMWVTNSYAWNNVLNGGPDTGVANESSVTAQNAQFWLHAPIGGQNFYPHTDLVYPHPLVTAQDGSQADPTINTQPQNQSVLVGQSATFTVSASSPNSLTLTYQWTFNGGNVGSNSSSYTRNNCQLADSGGQVQVTVSDSGSPGTATSSAATLTVSHSPQLLVIGAGVKIGAGVTIK